MIYDTKDCTMTFRDFFDIQYKNGIACLGPNFESDPDDIKFYNTTTIKNYRINIDDIIGTYHPGYKNRPLFVVYQDMAERFERYDVDNQQHLDYFTADKDEDDTWEIVVYHGKGYVRHDGNHRTIAAKILAYAGKIPKEVCVAKAIVVS